MKFILSRELGRLVKWLRILGFDTQYFCEDKISSLIIQALRDERLILTRNKKLSQRKGIKVIEIKKDVVKDQLKELLKTLKIKLDSSMIFTRCILCNAILESVNKDDIKDKIPEYIFETQNNFVTCPKCRRVYWQGTHWGNVSKILQEIKEDDR
ncbi:MAG: Mut7-C RNAse domain-containing protein [Candidatus Omnitrophota bacterium]